MQNGKPRRHPKPRPNRPRPSRDSRPRNAAVASGAYWIYGHHTVAAALANPARRTKRLIGVEKALESLRRTVGDAAIGQAETTDREGVERLLPRGAVHQGLALEALPLTGKRFEDAVALHDDRIRPNIVVLLDQVTDPHNIGAVLRSAAAFEARAVVVTERHAPGETGALAKAASGALDLVPYLRVTNLARALVFLAEIGYWRIGLDSSGARALDAAGLGDGGHDDVVIVLGAEGRGMRALTMQRTDEVMRLGLPSADGPDMPSLNVSNAAAIALYELTRSRR
jgi:23S rRNA (guanosine2251-2'-O)-methyltransferase